MNNLEFASGFQGDLAALSVVDIVQTVSLARRNARVALQSRSASGEIWFESGAITHATTGPLFGALAVYAMIEWTTGRFQVEYGPTCRSRSIAEDTTHLLLEGCRLADEKSSGPKGDAPGHEVRSDAPADPPRRPSLRLALGVIGLALIAGALAFAQRSRTEMHPAATATTASTAAPGAHATRTSDQNGSRGKHGPQDASAARRVPAGSKSPVVAPPLTAPESPLAEEPIPAPYAADLEQTDGRDGR